MTDGSTPGPGASWRAGAADAGQGAWDSIRPPELDLIRDCVHCGFCLATCPSYLVFEEEMDSPRGRLVLMRVGHEPGQTISDEMTTHLDRCLGCMACVTACPSGVRYDRLIEQARPQVDRHGTRTWRQRLLRATIFGLFTHPARLRAITPLIAAGAAPPLRELLGERLPFLRLVPRVSMRSPLHRLPLVTAALGERRGTVAFMQGCVQRALFGDVNAATVRVLAAEGFEVHAPRRPRCCGALQFHAGVERPARRLAEQTVATFERYDTVLTNVAGCGSAMRDYGHLFEDDDRFVAFSARVRDVHEFLAGVEPRARRQPLPLRLAYHDACHLAHAQGVRAQPRQLLASIPGIELLEPAEWELCCGSAGTYNLTQPAAAAELGRRKADNIRATGAEAIAAANPGCAIQIGAYLDIPIHHPMTLLDHSIRGTRP